LEILAQGVPKPQLKESITKVSKQLKHKQNRSYPVT